MQTLQWDQGPWQGGSWVLGQKAHRSTPFFSRSLAKSDLGGAVSDEHRSLELVLKGSPASLIMWYLNAMPVNILLLLAKPYTYIILT